MKIAYRRMSGAIGLTQFETGTRGLWLEKRLALIAELTRRGHQVHLVNRMTKYSQPIIPAVWDTSYDLLFVEFGSSNAKFYGEDLKQTQHMVATHRGYIVFLCDDPDLPYLWKTVPDVGRWAVWLNAKYGEPFGGQPDSIPIYDAPFAALLKPPGWASPGPDSQGVQLVYNGRAKGREAAFRALFAAGVPFVVAGRPAEWKDFPATVIEAPTQAHRAEFYRTKLGSLVLADKKHKKLGWRTGRAYHALYAGTPAVVERSHRALAEVFDTFETTDELTALVRRWQEPTTRRQDWEAQMVQALADREVMERTFCSLAL